MKGLIFQKENQKIKCLLQIDVDEKFLSLLSFANEDDIIANKIVKYVKNIENEILNLMDVL